MQKNGNNNRKSNCWEMWKCKIRKVLTLLSAKPRHINRAQNCIVFSLSSNWTRSTATNFNNGSLTILAYVRPTPFIRSPCGNATSPWLQHWNPARGWQNGEAQYSAWQKRSRIEQLLRLRTCIWKVEIYTATDMETRKVSLANASTIKIKILRKRRTSYELWYTFDSDVNFKVNNLMYTELKKIWQEQTRILFYQTLLQKWNAIRFTVTSFFSQQKGTRQRSRHVNKIRVNIVQWRPHWRYLPLGIFRSVGTDETTVRV